MWEMSRGRGVEVPDGRGGAHQAVEASSRGFSSGRTRAPSLSLNPRTPPLRGEARQHGTPEGPSLMAERPAKVKAPLLLPLPPHLHALHISPGPRTAHLDSLQQHTHTHTYDLMISSARCVCTLRWAVSHTQGMAAVTRLPWRLIETLMELEGLYSTMDAMTVIQEQGRIHIETDC